MTSIWMLKFAPMTRDIDVKRHVDVLSSGCGDLTRTQTKVESTDGIKEEFTQKRSKREFECARRRQGHQYLLLQEIMLHRKDHSAVLISEGIVRSVNSMKKPKSQPKVGSC